MRIYLCGTIKNIYYIIAMANDFYAYVIEMAYLLFGNTVKKREQFHEYVKNIYPKVKLTSIMDASFAKAFMQYTPKKVQNINN